MWREAMKDKKFPWLSIAPFGGPVVPLVYEKVKQFFSLTSTCLWSISWLWLTASSKWKTLNLWFFNWFYISDDNGSKHIKFSRFPCPFKPRIVFIVSAVTNNVVMPECSKQ